MPTLFYGTPDGKKKPRLYSRDLRKIEVKIFDHFKIDTLGPDSGSPNLAVAWHVHDHSALAWYDDRGIQQVLYLPGLLDQRNLLLQARENFPSQLPPALLFRISNEGETYEW